MKKQLIKVTVCALIAAFCVAPVSNVRGLGLDFKAVAAETAEAEETKTKAKTNDESAVAETTTKKKSNPLKGVKERIEKAKKDNPNNKGIVGWLTVTGTNINEPICYTSKGNSYYLYRDIKGTNYPQIASYPNYKNYPDSVTYLDYRTVLGEKFTDKGTSRNYVLYGHNWNNLYERDGGKLAIGNKPGYTMFAQLPSYHNMSFAEKNPYIYFSTETDEGIWQVFSVGYTEVSNKFPYHVPYTSKAKTSAIINEWKQRTMFNFDVDVNEDDRILTLSTCTRQYAGVGENQRFVVVARLLREGESVKNKVSVEVNSNMKQPKF